MDVLLIEDDPTARETASLVLEKAGFSVLAVENAIAGYAELNEHPFRAIVCDYRLPFMEGSSFYDRLKEDFPEMAKRVVFVTGWANDPETRQRLDVTGQPVVAKPYEVRDLITVVQQVWGKSEK